MKKIKINYDVLRTGDMVVCGGKGFTANIIRRATVGRGRARDASISVHTGMVVKWGGQFFIAEMLAKGITLSPFARYEKGKRRRFIIDIRRSRVYDDKELRENLQKRVALDYRHSISYDWKGDIGFVFKKVKQNKKRFYCSEHYHYQTQIDGVKYPPIFNKFVSPHDLQRCPFFFTVHDWAL